jgi:aldehyde dehydrogenase (NAD+)
VFSADGDRAAGIAARMRVGTVNVNGGVWYAADAPFGGYKQSGNGREMGLLGFEEYTEAKVIATAVN